MKSPEWSTSELEFLHQLFLDLRGDAFTVERRSLAFRLILLPASMARLQKACHTECKSRPRLANWREDVFNEAQLRLAGWLSADSLNYVDSGIEQFGSWYWTLCRRACRRAANAFGNTSQSLAFIDPEHLVQCPETRQVREHCFDRLSRAIARLSPGPQQNVILDWKSGLTVDESARRRGIPPRTVDWLRRRGRQLMLESCDADAATDRD